MHCQFSYNITKTQIHNNIECQIICHHHNIKLYKNVVITIEEENIISTTIKFAKKRNFLNFILKKIDYVIL